MDLWMLRVVVCRTLAVAVIPRVSYHLSWSSEQPWAVEVPVGLAPTLPSRRPPGFRFGCPLMPTVLAGFSVLVAGQMQPLPHLNFGMQARVVAATEKPRSCL